MTDENLMHEPDEAHEDHTGEAVPVEPAAATDEPGETTEGTEEETEPDESTKAGREAAKYRRRLRETEAERDALAGRLEALQRADAERVAGEHLHKPAGLWAAGTTVADLLDEEGALDPEKIREAAAAARDELGLAPRRRNVVPGEGANPRMDAAPRSSGTQGMVEALKTKR